MKDSPDPNVIRPETESADAPVLTSAIEAGQPAGAAAPIESVVEEAFDAYAGRLKAFARAAVRDEDAADDLVQETFLRLVQHLRQSAPPENIGGWLYRVCANLVVSRGRRRSVAERMRRLLIDRSTSPPPDEAVIRSAENARLRDALLELPADARVAVLMAAEGFSAIEIGTAIGRSPGATATYISRARVRLRERLSIAEGDGA